MEIQSMVMSLQVGLLHNAHAAGSRRPDSAGQTTYRGDNVFIHSCLGFCVVILLYLCVRKTGFCTSQVTGWEDRLWNDL